MITYNHERFIEQAIKGVISQKTNYSFELIIGEDGSTDKTRAICKKMAEKHPFLIKLLPAEPRMGMMKNFVRTLSNCNGKYIALCDGDDYWTNPKKLQKQVAFLESNPGYAICCHRVSKQKDGKKPKLDTKDIYAPSIEAIYDIEMMAKEGNLAATPSVVYRNRLFSSFPAWFPQTRVADYVLNMLNAQQGKIKYFPDAMAVYREHAKGAWSGKTNKENADAMIKVINLLLTESFKEPVKKGLREQLRKTKTTYLYELMQEDWEGFRREFEKMTGEDKTLALELIARQKKEMDVFRKSKGYKAIEILRKNIRR